MSKPVDPTNNMPLEEEIKLLKSIRSRGLVPLITEKELPNVPHLADVQGDVLYAFPKASPDHMPSYERFIFFRIKDRDLFKRCLHNFKPTSSQDVKDNLLKIAQAREEIKRTQEEEFKRTGRKLDPNSPELVAKRVRLKQYLIGFSRSGLNFLGVDERTGDERFDKRCMKDDRVYLGDQQKWDDIFDKQEFNEQDGSVGIDEGALHGVIAIATDNKRDLIEADGDLVRIFGKSWSIPKGGRLDGQVRPGKDRHNEHFGYKDGISQPAIRDLNFPLPGQMEVDPGVIVMGYPGDPVPTRPGWTKDGTVLVFRKLEQSVLLFENYVKRQGKRWREFFPGGEEVANNIYPPLSEEEGAELFGARFMGRWRSGAPLQLTPYRDDPELGADPKRNNNFDYVVRDAAGISSLTPSDHYCPFTAHARKTGPRNLDPFVSRQYLESSSIIRAGIPYGPEVEPDERAEWEDNLNSAEEAHAKNVEDAKLAEEAALQTLAEEGEGSEEVERILREAQAARWKSLEFPKEKDRGLLFACYASHLDSGFVRQTTKFGNNDFFPNTEITPTFHGQDPIIGGPPADKSSRELREVMVISQPIKPPRPRPDSKGNQGDEQEEADAEEADEAPGGEVFAQADKNYSVSDGEQVHLQLNVTEATGCKKRFELSAFVKAKPKEDAPGADNPYFVTSRGGEYFFVPSVPTLKSWAIPSH